MQHATCLFVDRFGLFSTSELLERILYLYLLFTFSVATCYRCALEVGFRRI